MAKKLAYLEYCFLFDPGQLWTRASEFDKELLNFFEINGMDAEIITTVGSTAKKMIYLYKKNDNPKVPSTKPQPIPKELRLPNMMIMGRK